MVYYVVQKHWWVLVVMLAAAGLSREAASDEVENSEGRYYSIDVALLSFRPGEGLAACRSYGRGSASGNATVGHWVKDGPRNFGVTIQCKMKSHQFWAIVRVEPSDADKMTEARVHEVNLAELTPRAIELAKDEDGRVYRLNLMPSVREIALPKEFRVRDLRLEDWSFPNCPVILNDERYLGRISCSHGRLAWLDIPGVGLIEFSLTPFVDAEPSGVLNNGTVGITHSDGSSIQITGVTNGVRPTELVGGPFRVWVRWKDSTHTVEEARQLVQEQLLKIGDQVKAGELVLPARAVERLQKIHDSDGICLMSNGVRALFPNERLPNND